MKLLLLALLTLTACSTAKLTEAEKLEIRKKQQELRLNKTKN